MDQLVLHKPRGRVGREGRLEGRLGGGGGENCRHAERIPRERERVCVCVCSRHRAELKIPKLDKLFLLL